MKGWIEENFFWIGSDTYIDVTGSRVNHDEIVKMCQFIRSKAIKRVRLADFCPEHLQMVLTALSKDDIIRMQVLGITKAHESVLSDFLEGMKTLSSLSLVLKSGSRFSRLCNVVEKLEIQRLCIDGGGPEWVDVSQSFFINEFYVEYRGLSDIDMVLEIARKIRKGERGVFLSCSHIERETEILRYLGDVKTDKSLFHIEICTNHAKPKKTNASELIGIRKYRKSKLNLLPTDLVRSISKEIWKSRYE
jgi:hypothetical protein